MFRGARIGKVDDFPCIICAPKDKFKIPVLITLFPEKINGIGIELDFTNRKISNDGMKCWRLGSELNCKCRVL